MTPHGDIGIQGYKDGENLMDRLAHLDRLPPPPARQQAVAIGLIIAFVVLITLL